MSATTPRNAPNNTLSTDAQGQEQTRAQRRWSGLRVATNVRAGGVIRNMIHSVPSSLRWFGA